MRTYDLKEHVNYVHLVGEVNSLEYIKRKDGTNYCLCKIEVQTSYKNKQHPPMMVDIICWDRLADGVYDQDLLSQNLDGIGDVISVEGRLTIRNKNGRTYYDVTGNKIQICKYDSATESWVLESI